MMRNSNVKITAENANQTKGTVSHAPTDTQHGDRLLSQQVRRAEYYPRGSLLSRASIHDESAHPEQDFLYVGTVNSATYVCGSAAAQDVTALEDVGVRVNHHDRATVSHGQT
jgi:hypothetical protein